MADVKYYNGLQASRGIAALLVVIFHAPLTLQLMPRAEIPKVPIIGTFGFFGVELFFVISGFIIYEVLGRQNFATVPFLIKRFFRLWPPYLAATLCFVSIASIAHFGQAYPKMDFTFSNLFYSLIFWPQQNTPILGPGWSLEHEVIYYISGALVTGLLGRSAFFYYMIANTIIGLAAVTILGLKFWDWHILSILNGYFLIGTAISRYRSQLSKAGFLVPAVIGSVLFLVGPYPLRAAGYLSHGIYQLIVVGGGSGLIVIALINIDRDESAVAVAVRNSVFFRALRKVGDWSYSLYILHFSLIPIFSAAFLALGKPSIVAIPFQAVFVLTAIALSALAYRAIERPSDEYGTKVVAEYNRSRTAVRAVS